MVYDAKQKPILFSGLTNGVVISTNISSFYDSGIDHSQEKRPMMHGNWKHNGEISMISASGSLIHGEQQGHTLCILFSCSRDGTVAAWHFSTNFEVI